MSNDTPTQQYNPPNGVTLDTNIRPQDDFFQFVNKSWLDAHPIPDSETRWGTFNVLRENSWNSMKAIYEELQKKDVAGGSIQQIAKDFYYTGTHYDEFEAQHISIITEYLDQIEMIHDASSLSRMIGQLHAADIDCFWQTYVDSDHDDSTKHILYFLAQISRPSADLRDVEKNYNKTTYAALISDYNNIDWPEYAKALGWTADDKISVRQPEFLAHVNGLFVDDQLSVIKQYLKWMLLTQCLSKISPQFSQIHFDFHGRVLSGTTEMMPLWKRVVLAAEYTIGDGTGQLYAEKHFPESSKEKVLKLVTDVQSSFDTRIDSLDWMSDDTKSYAKQKLANMKVLIGYPDKWRDFSNLHVTRDSYLGNILSAQKHEVAYWMGRLHQPISRDDWYMTPQTVNAYHDPNRLVICFPAGILQAPFFDPNASYASNMGGIGTVIGHELTHGFDDQGCQFDAEGNVRTWQSDEERAAFDKKAQLIVDQADAFEVLPDLYLRGKLVLGESIADLGGIEIALHSLKNQTPAADLPSAISEFLINYAFTECSNVRPEKTREYTLSDPHPASEFRVNGILQHVDDFYSSFDITTGDKLYTAPSERARIW
ncbi:MAG: M13 family peptidase [Chloroflexi bacterium]|nr:MAG: M13 family peptidase [Chloroflexota bacterium]